MLALASSQQASPADRLSSKESSVLFSGRTSSAISTVNAMIPRERTWEGFGSFHTVKLDGLLLVLRCEMGSATKGGSR